MMTEEAVRTFKGEEGNDGRWSPRYGQIEYRLRIKHVFPDGSFLGELEEVCYEEP